MSWTYDEWLQYYKGKSVHEITLEEHVKWSNEFQKWRKNNIE